MVIKFHFNSSVTLNNRNKLKLFISKIFKWEKTNATSLDIVFCDDEFLIDINRKFLNHDYYTDIISFNLNDDFFPVVGEIYISIDRVNANALTYNCSLTSELHRVIFHGVLHFCGFNDTTSGEKILMKAKEDLYLHKYFVSRGTKNAVPRETNR
ncbi:MAG: rRNA maturation RNase YbeY [Ferruginibacter sp.]